MFISTKGILVAAVVQLTLCDPKDCSTPGSSVFHDLLEFAQIQVHWDGDAVFLLWEPCEQYEKATRESWTTKMYNEADAEAKTPVLWPPDVKNWLIWKDPDAGKDWKWEDKGLTEDEMVGWHHQLDGHAFEQAPGVGDGQGGLVCCGLWGRKELDTTEWLNWTEVKINKQGQPAFGWRFKTQHPNVLNASHVCVLLNVKWSRSDWIVETVFFFFFSLTILGTRNLRSSCERG